MYDPELPEDDDLDLLDEFEGSSGWTSEYVPSIRKLLIGITVVAGAAFGLVLLSWVWGNVVRGDTRVELRGPHVSELRPGARVVLGTMVVGEVEEINLRAGKPVASLRIDSEYASEIPGSSQFEIDSLNEWWPGNLGIRIRCGESDARRDTSPIAHGQEIQTVSRTLPPAIPEKFYLLIFACVVAIVLVTILARLLFKAVWMLVVMAALACAAAVVAYLNNTISAG